MLRCITNNCFESLNNLILRKIFSGTKKSKRKRKLTPVEPETDVGFLWQDEEFKKLKIRKYKADLEEQELRMNSIREQTNLFVEQSDVFVFKSFSPISFKAYFDLNLFQ